MIVIGAFTRKIRIFANVEPVIGLSLQMCPGHYFSGERDRMSDLNTVNPINGFAVLGLDARLCATLTSLNYQEPTPIQKEAIPLILEGKDLIGQASTGTGKTAAFALPLLHRLSQAKASGEAVSALVLVPTRELAIQVSEAIRKYAKGMGLFALPIFGGQPYSEQSRGLRRGADIVVATPGRLLDHMRQGAFPHRKIATVVLDEADEMLDMGFADDIEAILKELPAERQTLLFSATMPPRIVRITEKYLRNPKRISLTHSQSSKGEKPRVRQSAYVIQSNYKSAALVRILEMEDPTSAIIFCRTRTETGELTQRLIERGYHAAALHGGMEQPQRDRVMKDFREESLSLLVATDIAARGLDISHLSHVVNYHIPESTEAYVHRIGRVGRAGREGVAITLIEPKDQYSLKNIERVTGQPIAIAKLPTKGELKARRLERTTNSLRETLVQGELEAFRVIFDALKTDYDSEEIVLAAIKMAHEQGRVMEDEEIPEVSAKKKSNYRDSDRSSKGKNRTGSHPPMTRLFFGAGRENGLTPRDLVGAIANETGLSSRDIGTIDISERFSLVEVIEEASDYVIEVMQSCRIKGNKVRVRRERETIRGRS
jgi:ATP-dependent RNA helicase DeaD